MEFAVNTEEANSLRNIARQTVRLWRKHHLTYDQTKHVVEHARRELHLEPPKERRRTVDRLDRAEVERLIDATYAHSSRYGFMIKMLFYTGARVSEFVQFRVEDLHMTLDPPQVVLTSSLLPFMLYTFPKALQGCFRGAYSWKLPLFYSGSILVWTLLPGAVLSGAYYLLRSAAPETLTLVRHSWGLPGGICAGIGIFLISRFAQSTRLGIKREFEQMALLYGQR